MNSNQVISKALNSLPNAVLYVTVPVYFEKNTKEVLESLATCINPGAAVQVDVFINASESDTKEIHELNSATYKELNDWITRQQSEFINFRIDLDNNIPERIAGVGYARKFLMDRAAAELKNSHPTTGIISCLDADCRVAPTYLIELIRHFRENKNTRACSLYFEHPTKGDDYPAVIYSSITYYELYLRYYKNALQYTGHPYWYFTVGSAMAVRADAYHSEGGMNRRKAGEDFYFLQKMMSTGEFSELNTTAVYPSPRISARVPFGTGIAVGKLAEQIKEEADFIYTTYAFSSFQVLKSFFDRLPELYNSNPLEIGTVMQQLPEVLQEFLMNNHATNRILGIKNNAGSLESFTKGFYNWFNPFKVLKFIHFARDRVFPNEIIINAIRKWADESSEVSGFPTTKNPGDLLPWMREIDRGIVGY